MSVLDELRKKADEKKAAEQQQAITNDRLDQVYQTKILPKMQLIFDGFQEAITYLNFLEEPIKVQDYCEKYPQFGDLFQSKYKMNTDGRLGFADYNKLMQINVGFICEAGGEFSYQLESEPLIDNEINFLQEKKLIFDSKNKSISGGGRCTVFTIQRKIPVAFRVEVDYQNALFKVFIRNHENLQLFTKTFTPEQVDDKFLEALLCYFLRKDNRFIKTDDSLSAESKNAIKAAVQSRVANYQQQHQTLLPPEDDEANRPKQNPIKSLLAILQKKI